MDSYGRRCFAAASPSTWNSLSDSLSGPTLSLSIFRRRLKTLFANYCRDVGLHVLSTLEIFLWELRYINAKIWPSADAKPLHRHQILNTWLRREHTIQKLGLNSPRGFAPHMREIYTLNLRIFTLLFSVLPSPHKRGCLRLILPFEVRI